MGPFAHSCLATMERHGGHKHEMYVVQYCGGDVETVEHVFYSFPYTSWILKEMLEVISGLIKMQTVSTFK